MAVRAKFVCIKNSEQTIKMQPVTSGSKENEAFFKYTPGGEINLYGITNPEAEKQFEVGREYYVDFTPVETEN